MPVLLPALSALSGALIGAFAAILSSWLAGRRQDRIERLRWEREDAARFHEIRRDLYARYIALATRAYRKTNQRSNLRKQEATNPRSKEMADALSIEISQAGVDLGEILEHIHLVAAAPVQQAADRIADTVLVWRLELANIDKSTLRYLKELRKQFYVAARNELRVSPSEPQQPQLNEPGTSLTP